MSGELRRFEERAKYILQMGWLSREVLRNLLIEVQHQPGLDMDSLLLSRSLLTIEQIATIPTRPSIQEFEAQLQRRPRRRRTKTPIVPVNAEQQSAEHFRKKKHKTARIQALKTEAPPPLSVSTDIVLAKKRKRLVNRPQVGKAFGDYHIMAPLGQGAMGVVFHARQVKTEQEVAIKFISDSEPDPDDVTRFQKEVRTLIHLKHPNIIEITDYGEIEGNLFFAMEYLEGYDLENWVSDSIDDSSHPPSWEKVTPYITEIAEALDYCHENGVLHRDVKPKNIFIDTNNNRAVLLDFGLMRKQNLGFSGSGSAAHRLTMTGEMVGTPAFMGPEQFSHGGIYGEPSPYSDVWGIGSTMFFALTGLPPFNQPNVADIYQALVSQAPPLPSSLNEEIPAWLDQICLETMAREQHHRIPMSQFIQKMALRGAKPFPIRPLIGGLLGSCLVAFLCALLFMNQPDQGLKILSFQASKTITKKRTIRVYGKLNLPSRDVQVGEYTTKANKDGVFEQVIPLTHGPNEIIVTLPNKAEKSIIVHYDAIPPRVSYFNPVVNIVAEGKVAYQLNSDSVLKGRIKDLYPLSISCAELVVEPDEQGLFELKFPQMKSEKGYVEFTVTILDKAGNTSREPLRIVPAPVQEQAVIPVKKFKEKESKSAQELVKKYIARHGRNPSERRLWALLCERRQWQVADAALQDQAIAMITVKLVKSFEYLGTKKYDCGGDAYRIAVFRQRHTKSLFHLIPGQIVNVNWHFNPEIEYVVEYLRALANQAVSNPVLQATLENPPYRGFKQAIIDQFKLPLQEMEFEEEVKRDYDAQSITGYFKEHKNALKSLRRLFERHLTYYQSQRIRKRGGEFIAPFLLARYECTEKVWSMVPGTGEPSQSMVPATKLEFSQVKKWLRAMNQSQLPHRLRLPSRLEWQYACRAGVTHRFFWGDSLKDYDRYVWSAANAQLPQSVLEHKKFGNAFGLVDMIGNVEEWCESDWRLWQKRRPKGRISEDDWARYQDMRPVLGGSTLWPSELCRSSLFHYKFRDRVWGSCGLRLAVSLPMN
jgi:serine/threonine protein kinase